MEDYKPNSNRFKEEQKSIENKRKVEKVVTGKVITKKKSKFSKIVGAFISEDANSVGSYVFGEVLIPVIKKAISDIITDGTDIILYGETRKGGKRSISDRVSYTNYSNRDYRPSRIERGSSYSNYSLDDIIIDNRREAEEVLSRMDELMETYGLVRVADFYDLVGVKCNYTDNQYGWTNIRNAEIVRARNGGYMIKMPRAVPID